MFAHLVKSRSSTRRYSDSRSHVRGMALPRGTFALFSNLDLSVRQQSGEAEIPVPNGSATAFRRLMQQWLCAAFDTNARLPYTVLVNVLQFIPRACWFVDRYFHAITRSNFQLMPIERKRALLQSKHLETCNKIHHWKYIREQTERQLRTLHHICCHPQKTVSTAYQYGGRMYQESCPDCGWHQHRVIDRHS